MGFVVAASTTVPDAEGETYVVISMQPLSDIRNERDSVWRHLVMCGLTVKLRGRPEALDWSRGRTLFPRARGDTTEHHGPLQRWLGLRLPSMTSPRLDEHDRRHQSQRAPPPRTPASDRTPWLVGCVLTPQAT